MGTARAFRDAAPPDLPPRRRPGASPSRRLAARLCAASVALFILTGDDSTADAADAAAPACWGEDEVVAIAGPADPLSLRLADGRTVRLADIRLAGPPEEAVATLAATAGKAAIFRPVRAADPRDRYGRLQGDVVVKDTTGGLRDRLIGTGLALVDPTVMSVACLDESFAAERRAEQTAKGVWSGRSPAVSAKASELLDHVGESVLVEGTVLTIGQSTKTIYLNFGAEWRTDFTAMIDRDGQSKWAEAPATLEGARVRIRGVLEAWNGGLIKVEHPAQIERLDAFARLR